MLGEPTSTCDCGALMGDGLPGVALLIGNSSTTTLGAQRPSRGDEQRPWLLGQGRSVPTTLSAPDVGAVTVEEVRARSTEALVIRTEAALGASGADADRELWKVKQYQREIATRTEEYDHESIREYQAANGPPSREYLQRGALAPLASGITGMRNAEFIHRPRLWCPVL